MREIVRHSGANNMEPVTIGYYDDNTVYLLPTETWHALQQYCKQEDTHFPFTKGTLYKMLKDRKLIAPDKDENHTIQKKIRGKNQRVLKLIGGGIVAHFVTSVTDDVNN